MVEVKVQQSYIVVEKTNNEMEEEPIPNHNGSFFMSQTTTKQNQSIQYSLKQR